MPERFVSLEMSSNCKTLHNIAHCRTVCSQEALLARCRINPENPDNQNSLDRDIPICIVTAIPMMTADNSVQSPISIVLFDVTGITSDLLKRAFSKQPEYEVVGCAKSIEEAIRIVIEGRPDAVIISAFERIGSV